MTVFARYFAIVIEDGDWLNDWLTHMPVMIRPLIAAIGQLIALLIGS